MNRLAVAFLLALAILASPAEAGFASKALSIGKAVKYATGAVVAGVAVKLAIDGCMAAPECKEYMKAKGRDAVVVLVSKVGGPQFLECLRDGGCLATMLGGTSTAAPAGSQSSPTGNCGPDQYDELNRRVGQACKGRFGGSEPRACKRSDTLLELRDKMNTFDLCHTARMERENICFGGGDAGHREQMDNLEKGFYNCAKLEARAMQ